MKELFEYMFVTFLSQLVVYELLIEKRPKIFKILNYGQIYVMTSKWTKTLAHIEYDRW